MPKASAFGGIPFPHPPPMASKAGLARFARGLLPYLTEQPPDENPGYAPDSDGEELPCHTARTESLPIHML